VAAAGAQPAGEKPHPSPAPATTAQPGAPPPFTPEGSRIWSMGQPPLLHWNAGAVADFEKDAGLAVVGVQKPFLSPLVGVIAGRVEGLIGGGREGVEGGARLLAVSPLTRLQFGLDYDARAGKVDFLLGGEFVVRRGGLFGGGTRLRLGWLPGRDQTLQVGLSVPVGQRAGRTRPRTVRLPIAERRPPPPALESGALPPALREFRAAAEAVTRLVIPLHTRLGHDDIKAVAPDLAAVSALAPADDVLAHILASWTQVFRAGVPGEGVPHATLATRARRIMLEDALLPFDGLLGQRRTKGSLYAFAEAAERRFAAEVASAGLTADQRTAALAVFHGVFGELDGVRAGVRRDWRSDRRVFLPLQLALAPEEHDTQAEIDALIERAVDGQFEDGNRIYYVLNEAFQFEFSRTVALAERFHVLWIHDIRGSGETGGVDKVSTLQIREYLKALTDRVQRYDETGRLPQYHIIIDQYFYQANGTRRWMTLLEHPLTHTIDFPPGSEAEERTLREAQQALRTAVAGSERLQALRDRFGEAWLQNQVRVHVNVTHPSDFAFWSGGLLPLMGMPDNLMRDHRKIVYYDLSEDEPAAGEVLFSGMGIGEHYAGATWEDRAIILQGPAALGIKAAARRLFERQGIKASQLAEPFHDQPRPADFDARAQAARDTLASSVVPFARVLQGHNDVGYGTKKATVSKALLLSVMPSGSVLIAPDSLWEDFLWGSLMLGSSLRGCRSLVIAPSFDNAPGTSWPIMARAYMLTSRLLALSKGLEARITAQGGLFKVGLFSEASPVGDMGARALEAERNFAAARAWLRVLIPFSDDTMHQWRQGAAEITAAMPPSYLVEHADENVRPKLHMKGLYAVSRSAWDGLHARPEMTRTLLEYLTQRGRQVSGQQRDVRELPEKVWAARRVLLAAHEADLSPDELAKTVRYLQIGSFNMNDRSMLLDGEVELTVSGLAAESGMLDFIIVCGLTTWVDDQKQIDALLPAPSAFKRLVARWGRSVL
jgi:hypothetical protein